MVDHQPEKHRNDSCADQRHVFIIEQQLPNRETPLAGHASRMGQKPGYASAVFIESVAELLPQQDLFIGSGAAVEQPECYYSRYPYVQPIAHEAVANGNEEAADIERVPAQSEGPSRNKLLKLAQVTSRPNADSLADNSKPDSYPVGPGFRFREHKHDNRNKRQKERASSEQEIN